MKKGLELLRKEIDRADSALLTILTRRVLCSKKIGQLKKKMGGKVVDEKRKKQMIAARIALGKKKGLSPHLIREVFEVIHKDSVKIQRRQK